MQIKVKKYSGELDDFRPDNLKSSLRKSGANNDEVEAVYGIIQQKVYDGITTNELYALAFAELKKIRQSYAARYSLKKALRELGPEGYYFEKWVARIFEDEGFETITSQTVQGKAVTHEVDVIAAKGSELYAIECKFRNDSEARISVTTPMYFLSRSNDLMGQNYMLNGRDKPFNRSMLVTNAYFTSDSIDFAEYYHLQLLAWNYPKNDGIKERVDNKGEYPITCLTSLTADDKARLLKTSSCILVKDLLDNHRILDKLQIPTNKATAILEEAADLLNLPTENNA